MDASNLIAPMMGMTRFLEPFDLSILSNEDVSVKYGLYKSSFAKDSITDYFNAHKNEAWFREKYHPDFISVQDVEDPVRARYEVFKKIDEQGTTSNLTLDQSNKTAVLEFLDSVNRDFQSTKASSNSGSACVIRIPNVPAQISKAKLQKLFSTVPSFTSLSVSEPIVCQSTQQTVFNPESGLARPKSGNEIRRPAWATFSSTVTVEQLQELAKSFDRDSASDLAEQCDAPSTAAAAAGDASDDEHPAPLKAPVAAPKANSAPSTRFQDCFNDAQILPENVLKAQLRVSRLGARVNLYDKGTVRRHIVMAAKLIHWFDASANLWKAGGQAYPTLWRSHDIPTRASPAHKMDVDKRSDSEDSDLGQRSKRQPINTPQDAAREEMMELPEVSVPRPWTIAELDPGPDSANAFKLLSTVIPSQRGDEQAEDSSCGCNPLLLSLMDNFVDEVSSDENLLSTAEAPEEPSTEDENASGRLLTTLDRLILYLRLVHSVDFYGPALYPDEHAMPHSCGLIHLRPLLAKSQKLTASVAKAVQLKAHKVFARQLVHMLRLRTPIADPTELLALNEARREARGEEAAETEEAEESAAQKVPESLIAGLIKAESLVGRLGLRDPMDAVEQFVKDNTRRKKRKVDVIWLCPLSDKKFREPIFVRKHIMNKFMPKVVEAKRENALFFNNYLLDPWRSQNVTRPRVKAPRKVSPPPRRRSPVARRANYAPDADRRRGPPYRPRAGSPGRGRPMGRSQPYWNQRDNQDYRRGGPGRGDRSYVDLDAP